MGRKCRRSGALSDTLQKRLRNLQILRCRDLDVLIRALDQPDFCVGKRFHNHGVICHITAAAFLKLRIGPVEGSYENIKIKMCIRDRGFRNMGLRRNFYEKPREDAVIMQKCLED